MHAVWGIPELAETIINYLPMSDLKRVLRCSRRDFLLASPRAWKWAETGDLARLLAVLPFDTDKDFALARFRIYASLVHTLRISLLFLQRKKDAFINDLNRVLYEGITVPLFSSLQTLDVDVMTAGSAETAMMLIQPNLRCILIKDCFYFDDPDDAAQTVWITRITALIHKLSDMQALTQFAYLYGRACCVEPETSFTLLGNVKSLTKIQFSSLPITTSTLSTLTSLPHLEELVLRKPSSRAPPETLELISGFERLSVFRCTAYAEENGLICTLLSKTSELREVDVEIYHFENGDVDLHNICLGIARSKGSVRSIKLTNDDMLHFDCSSLEPLYECHGLERMTLAVHGHVTHIPDWHVKNMAEAWPNLQFLSLTATSDENEVTILSMDALYPLALHCPKLEYFRTNCIKAPPHADAVVPVQPGFSRLPLRLNLGKLSEIFEPSVVARYLGSLYGGRKIEVLIDLRKSAETDSELLPDAGHDTDVEEALERYHQAYLETPA
ncbi:hypothetical protein CALCODRAFT_498866 [Calocera cornea HHB12733]|uniref:F-box domain-containing protein n=1 Tax=Calocera cornea HHB12733 TaxID=1353952 RepID=A0A165EP87_9BASI|nr:hypothetical protein CALCODRAFT_498866 [Calocera cornea HHB12733]